MTIRFVCEKDKSFHRENAVLEEGKLETGVMHTV